MCRRLGRSARLLATAGVFRAPLLGRVVRKLGFIPVNRGAADASDSLAPAAEALAAGEVVAMFPEGRLTRDPNHWPEKAKTGRRAVGAAHRRADRAGGDRGCVPGGRQEAGAQRAS